MKLTGVFSVFVSERSRFSRSSARSPIIDPIGQLWLVDDDQKIEIRLVSLGRMWLIDPSTARK